MSYTDTDKKSHIKEIQQYLRCIAHKNGKIPKVVSNGIYGSETASAVRAFQTEYGLPVTGEVDEMTWSAIVDEYVSVSKHFTNPQYITPFISPNAVVNRDYRGNSVYIIQIMLNTLASKYKNIPNVHINGEFDTQTQNAVKAFQVICDFDETGNVDRETWDMLAYTYNAL